MVHDNFTKGSKSDAEKESSSLKDLFKLQLLCDRLNLSPIGVARMVKAWKSDVGNLVGKTGEEVGFDTEFSGREFDLIFTIPDPTLNFGKRRL